MIKVLITSVGSLVGQNILDLLEERRRFVTVVGLNSIPDSQRIYRCDRAYRVPETANQPEFSEAFAKLMDEESPDVVLAGRDEDVVFLARYRQDHPHLTSLIPVGAPCLAEMMFDKFESSVFARKNNLPFAATCLYRDGNDKPAVAAFLAEQGFPVIVKPRKGFASHNVLVVTGQTQIDALLADDSEILFQEYLSPPSDLDHYTRQLRKGLPLVFQIPVHDHMVSQVVLSQRGEILDSISTKQTLVMGRTEFARVYEDDELDRLVHVYARTLAAQGWWGFLNIQSRPDRHGRWKVFELNPRLSGASSARLRLGLDELGSLLNSARPEWQFPVRSSEKSTRTSIHKYLSDYTVDEDDVEQFRQNGIWIRA